jgi:hypothetical protein
MFSICVQKGSKESFFARVRAVLEDEHPELSEEEIAAVVKASAHAQESNVKENVTITVPDP